MNLRVLQKTVNKGGYTLDAQSSKSNFYVYYIQTRLQNDIISHGLNNNKGKRHNENFI